MTTLAYYWQYLGMSTKTFQNLFMLIKNRRIQSLEYIIVPYSSKFQKFPVWLSTLSLVKSSELRVDFGCMIGLEARNTAVKNPSKSLRHSVTNEGVTPLFQ